jgi:hypothetical protein
MSASADREDEIEEMLRWVIGKWSQQLPEEQAEEWVKQLGHCRIDVAEGVLSRMARGSLFRPSAAEFMVEYMKQTRGERDAQRSACECGGQMFTWIEQEGLGEVALPCRVCNGRFYEELQKQARERRLQVSGTLPPSLQITPAEEIQHRVADIFRTMSERAQHLDTAMDRGERRVESPRARAMREAVLSLREHPIGTVPDSFRVTHPIAVDVDADDAKTPAASEPPASVGAESGDEIF